MLVAMNSNGVIMVSGKHSVVGNFACSLGISSVTGGYRTPVDIDTGLRRQYVVDTTYAGKRELKYFSREKDAVNEKARFISANHGHKVMARVYHADKAQFSFYCASSKKSPNRKKVVACKDFFEASRGVTPERSYASLEEYVADSLQLSATSRCLSSETVINNVCPSYYWVGGVESRRLGLDHDKIQLRLPEEHQGGVVASTGRDKYSNPVVVVETLTGEHTFTGTVGWSVNVSKGHVLSAGQQLFAYTGGGRWTDAGVADYRQRCAAECVTVPLSAADYVLGRCKCGHETPFVDADTKKAHKCAFCGKAVRVYYTDSFLQTDAEEASVPAEAIEPLLERFKSFADFCELVAKAKARKKVK